MNNLLYIVDSSKPFEGRILNTMPFVDLKSKNGNEILNLTYVHYSDKTFEDYNKSNGGSLVALDYDNFNNQYLFPYLKKIQGKFQKISEEKYFDLLEVVPPKRFTNSKDKSKSFFFVGEAFTYNIHKVCVRIKDQYYSAYRAIDTNEDDLFNLKPIE